MLITSLASGLMIMLLGLLTWRFKLGKYLIRTRPHHEIDQEGLAMWLGKSMIGMGLALWVAAGIQWVTHSSYRWVDFAVILALSTRMAMGTTKYQKPLTKTPAKRSTKSSGKSSSKTLASPSDERKKSKKQGKK